MNTQREAKIDTDVEGEDREEEIESEGRRRCRRRRLGLEPKLMWRVRARARARAKGEVGQTRAWNNPPEFHALYFAFVALLHVHIQHLYHGDDSPFQTHPISMRISVVAIFSYGLAALFGHAQFCSNYSQIFNYVIMVLGVLYPVSLISVFIPNWLSCLFYISWLIFSVMVVPWDFLLVCSRQWILQKSGIQLFNMTTCPLALKLLKFRLLACNGLLHALHLWDLLWSIYFFWMSPVVATMWYLWLQCGTWYENKAVCYCKFASSASNFVVGLVSL